MFLSTLQTAFYKFSSISEHFTFLQPIRAAFLQTLPLTSDRHQEYANSILSSIDFFHFECLWTVSLSYLDEYCRLRSSFNLDVLECKFIKSFCIYFYFLQVGTPFL